MSDYRESGKKTSDHDEYHDFSDKGNETGHQCVRFNKTQ